MCAGCMREHVPASRIHNVFVFCNRLNFAHTIQDSRSGVDGRVAQRANPHVTVHTAQLLSFTIARMDDIHTGGVPPLRSRQHKAQSPPSHGRPTIEISDVTNKQATPSPLSLSISHPRVARGRAPSPSCPHTHHLRLGACVRRGRAGGTFPCVPSAAAAVPYSARANISAAAVAAARQQRKQNITHTHTKSHHAAAFNPRSQCRFSLRSLLALVSPRSACAAVLLTTEAHAVSSRAAAA